MKTRLRAAGFLAAASAGLALLPAAGIAGGASADWPSYLLNGAHSSYNAAATSIGPAQVPSLGPVWHWADPSATTLFASPVVYQGVVYQGDDAGTLFAIRESDRSVLWTAVLGQVQKTTCWTQGLVATPTVSTNPSNGRPTVYENGPDGKLHALDAATGAVVWTALVDTPSSTVNDYFAWSSPLVANGKVYVGVASECDAPLVHGGLEVFDQRTGIRLAFTQTMLNGTLGGDIWSTPAVLPDGSIVATTGNSGNDGDFQGDWADSVLRFDGSSLAILDAWQVPTAQRGDNSDFGGSPTLFTAAVHGISTPMLGACNKNGDFYALRQADLHDGPVWQINLGQPGVIGNDVCFASAIWDGSRLVLAAGGPTLVNGSLYDGSVRAVNPSTGAVLWQTGLPVSVVGSPTEDGAGVIAVPGYRSSTGTYGVFLVRASTGALLGRIPLLGLDFAQPVFAGTDLLVAGGPQAGLTAYDATVPGPPLTSLSPAFISPGETKTVTVAGSGFGGNPVVFVSGTGVSAANVHVVSPTQLTLTLTASPAIALGPRAVTVVEPAATTDACSSCLFVVAPSTTVLTSSRNPSVVGQPVTFTAAVAPTDGGGTVAFAVDGVTVAGCAAQTLTLGRATCTTSALTVKTHAITASYSGDNASGDSTGTLPGGQVTNAPPPPPTPTGVRAALTSATSITVSWTAVPGATKYILSRATSAGGTYTQVATVTAPTTSFLNATLAPHATYYFVVVASNGYTTSAPSASVSAATP